VETYRSKMTPDPLTLSSGEVSWRQLALELIETLLLSLVLFVAINSVSTRVLIHTASMYDTLRPGDMVYVNRLAYKFSTPGRGDVVVFDPPVESTEPFIKRLIGLPGEQVTIKDGRVYIEGELLQEPYIHDQTMPSRTWNIPKDSIFVMGDNRGNSSDSRIWGVVPLDNLIGRAVFVYWPPDQWGALARTAVAAESSAESP
jgi:signal peptidase I